MMNVIDRSVVDEAAELIIARFRHSWAYFCQFRFALAVCQRALMQRIPLQAPSLEIGINDGSSATIAHFGKPKFTYGGDMPEESTYESMGLHMDPNFDVYENVLGMDAHEIPFPDGSFNTIVTNDMLSYGLDRAKIIREMARVLAPGGTIFLTETSGNLEKTPYLLAELRKFVPTVAPLRDPVAFYRDELEALGMVDISVGTYFDHRLCATTLASLYRGEALNKVDENMRGFYEEGLRALASLLADDLAKEDAGEGWQVYVTCRKPGGAGELPTPKPVCLSCKTPLTITLNSCACPQCGAQYRNELGNPHILADFSKAYSPKSSFAPSANMQIIETLLGRLADRLQPQTSIGVFGFDRSTRFMIRFLRSRDIAVSTIYSDNSLFVDHEVLGVPIRSLDQLSGQPGPIVMSIFCPPEDAAKLRVVGYRGAAHQPDLVRGVWNSPFSDGRLRRFIGAFDREPIR